MNFITTTTNTSTCPLDKAITIKGSSMGKSTTTASAVNYLQSKNMYPYTTNNDGWYAAQPDYSHIYKSPWQPISYDYTTTPEPYNDYIKKVEPYEPVVFSTGLIKINKYRVLKDKLIHYTVNVGFSIKEKSKAVLNGTWTAPHEFISEITYDHEKYELRGRKLEIIKRMSYLMLLDMEEFEVNNRKILKDVARQFEEFLVLNALSGTGD